MDLRNRRRQYSQSCSLVCQACRGVDAVVGCLHCGTVQQDDFCWSKLLADAVTVLRVHTFLYYYILSGVSLLVSCMLCLLLWCVQASKWLAFLQKCVLWQGSVEILVRIALARDLWCCRDMS
jgi:hypothetical protein